MLILSFKCVKLCRNSRSAQSFVLGVRIAWCLSEEGNAVSNLGLQIDFILCN